MPAGTAANIGHVFTGDNCIRYQAGKQNFIQIEHKVTWLRIIMLGPDIVGIHRVFLYDIGREKALLNIIFYSLDHNCGILVTSYISKYGR